MRDNYLEEYYSFLRFPSVSTDDQYKEKLQECARWLVNKLTAAKNPGDVNPMLPTAIPTSRSIAGL